MDDKSTDMIRLYDSLTADSQAQKLKFLLPYFSGPTQKHLAVYIKSLELLYTWSLLTSDPSTGLSMGESPDPDTLYRHILPFCSEQEKLQYEQLLSFYHQLESMKEMMNTIQMMQELFPEGFVGEDGDMPDPELLRSLLGL